MPKIRRKKRSITPSELKNKYLLTYNSWKGMMNRPLSDKDYLELSIDVRWYSFSNFLKDMGKRPSKIHCISRKNHNEGYYKENCFWELIEENSRESRLRNNSRINSKTNNEKKRKRMSGIKIWKCMCGSRNYRVDCHSCGALKNGNTISKKIIPRR